MKLLTGGGVGRRVGGPSLQGCHGSRPWNQVPWGYLFFLLFFGFLVCLNAKTATRRAAQVGGAELVFLFIFLHVDFLPLWV